MLFRGLTRFAWQDLFSTPDEYKLLNLRATVTRVRSLLRSKGMYLLDAFNLFDSDRNNDLSPQELYGTAKLLVMSFLTPAFIDRWPDLVGSKSVSEGHHGACRQYRP